MAVFLAGVGNAEIFDGDTLIATAKTLVDSSITIGVTAEDIRAGMGAMLYGKYFHTSTFDLKLTDAMFNMQYIAMNVGADVTVGGDAIYDEELTSTTGGVVTLSHTAVPLASGGIVYAWARPAASPTASYTRYAVTGNTFTVPGVTSATAYCVKYVYTNNVADKVVVYGNFIPATVTIYLTANLYAGDSSNPSTGTQVGTVQIKVPRFLLNGAQELSMTMTGASQTSLEGSALGYGAEGCQGRAIYAEIIQIMSNARWFDNASGIMIEDSDVSLTLASAATALVGTSPNVYALYPNKMPKQINNAIISNMESGLLTGNSKLVYSIAPGTTGLSMDSTTGVFSGTPAAGSATVTVVAQQNNGTWAPIPGLDAAMVITLA